MLDVTYDDANGIVTTKAIGMSSAQDFNAYLPTLLAHMTKSLARHGKWLHLVDASENPVQPKDDTDHVKQLWNAKPRLDGFTAYVVQSVLAKMQIQRMRDDGPRHFFTDTASARQWLLEQAG